MIQAALSACSDFDHSRRMYAGVLTRALEELQIQVLRTSTVITSRDTVGPREKAEELNSFFADPGTSRIYDMSGGNSAEELLPYLDYEAIGSSPAVFYGYSDLTVILNGIFARTGKEGVLWSVMNLLRSDSVQQRSRLDTADMYRFRIQFLQGSHMEGTLLGGNIRCFLKLAGTAYFPDLQDKLLLLEARSGEEAQIRSYFSRLQQLGAFDRVRGIVLGTFTVLEKNGGNPWELLKDFIPERLPVAGTAEVGHGGNSRAVRIGGYYRLDASLGTAEPSRMGE